MGGHVAMPPRAHGRAGTHLLGRRSAGGVPLPTAPQFPEFRGSAQGAAMAGQVSLPGQDPLHPLLTAVGSAEPLHPEVLISPGDYPPPLSWCWSTWFPHGNHSG